MTTGLLAKKLINEIPEYYTKNIETFRYIKQFMIRTATDNSYIEKEIKLLGNDDLSLQLYFKGVVENKQYYAVNLAIELANIPLSKSKNVLKVLKLHLKQNAEYRPRVYSESLYETTDKLEVGNIILYKNNSNTPMSYYDKAKNDYFEIVSKHSFPEYLRMSLTEKAYQDITIEQDTVLFLGKSLSTGETQFISERKGNKINEDIIKNRENSQFACYVESTYESERNRLHFYIDIRTGTFANILNYKIPEREYFLPNDFIFCEGHVYFIHTANYDFEAAKEGKYTSGIIYQCINFVSKLDGALLSYSCDYLKYGQDRYGSGSDFKGFHQYDITDTGKFRFATKEEIMFYLTIAGQNHPKPK
jgi:hypothetical protein